MRIALVHYAAPPVIGGVERVIEQQAKILMARGHEVRILCGNEGARIPGAVVQVHPGLKATRGSVGAAPSTAGLESMLEGCEIVIIHNMLTMPFNWTASTELARLSRELPESRFINWLHDVDVPLEDFAALEAQVTHVAVSKVRQQEFCRCMKLPLKRCRVIPNGVDVADALGLTPEVASYVQKHALLDRDLILLHPSRVLARKNIELGLAITAALREQGKDAVYLVTGAPDPHRKESAAYALSLQKQIKRLRLQQAVFFVSETFPVQNADVASFYRIADALLFPSRSEGFGLPLLEAVLHRLPVFCSDIPPHREVAAGMATYFDLEQKPATIARLILRQLKKDSPGIARRRVVARFGWEHISKEYLEPLIKER